MFNVSREEDYERMSESFVVYLECREKFHEISERFEANQNLI
jgi:hypothetical protein